MSDSFDDLPPTLQRRIDKVFNDTLAASSLSRPRCTNEDTDGGYLVDDEPLENQISLSSVPDALRRLNLPPNDDQVLSVFRKAASGWSSANSTDERGHVPESDGLVTRDDWRSVCAVLLEHHAEELEESDEGSVYDDKIDGDIDSDEYVSTGASGSDDEYQEASTPKTPGRHLHVRHSDFGSTKPSILTKKQKEKCLGAYSLFFPSVPLADLPNQKIMIKDIQRVAGILGEKLTANEIIEMLEAFSSSPDKSVSFADFSRMMMVAKLV